MEPESTVKFIQIVLTIMVISRPLTGQTCCMLQGHTQTVQTNWENAVLGTVNGRNPSAWSWLLESRGDIRQDPFIQQTPQLVYHGQMSYLYRPQVVVSAGIIGQSGGFREQISFSHYQTQFLFGSLFTAVQLNPHSQRSAIWLRTTLPVLKYYSNSDFPFTASPSISVEFGGILQDRSFRPVWGLSGSLIRELNGNNLFNFSYRTYFQYWREVFKTGKVSWQGFLEHKSGLLSGIQDAVYQSAFPKAIFGFGNLGLQMTYGIDPSSMVVRFRVTLPFLRWSDARLPTGFSENPSISISIQKTIHSIFMKGKKND